MSRLCGEDDGSFDPVKAAYRGGWSRTALARYLEGRGHRDRRRPQALAPSRARERASRWSTGGPPRSAGALFPELGEGARFSDPDVVCDMDRDGLAPFADASLDFVIASQILEHLANPLRVLDEIHRVLRPGGVVLLLLPDRRRTFDHARPATGVDHVVAEYEAGVTEVDDAHIEEFVTHTGPLTDFGDISRSEEIELHRKRSIHVHSWHEEDFLGSSSTPSASSVSGGSWSTPSSPTRTPSRPSPSTPSGS